MNRDIIIGVDVTRIRIEEKATELTFCQDILPLATISIGIIHWCILLLNKIN